MSFSLHIILSAIWAQCNSGALLGILSPIRVHCKSIAVHSVLSPIRAHCKSGALLGIEADMLWFRRSIVGLLTAAASILPLSSCRRDHLYYASSNTATVLIKSDWAPSGVKPNGVSVFAFSEPEGTLYKRFPPVSASEKCYIKLPEGDFSLVVMNDTPEEFGGKIDFVGTDNISTFQARGVVDEVRSKKLTDYLASLRNNPSTLENNSNSSEYCIVEPDTLAASVVHGLHISPDQIDYFYDKPDHDISVNTAVVVPVTPVPVLSRVVVQVHVKGLKYARGTTLSYLRGVAAGHKMGFGVNSDDGACQAFILNNRVFDPGSDSDGTISASFQSFGLVGDGNTDSRYYLDINFVLINGESYPLSFDVTDKIVKDINLSLQLYLRLDLDIELPKVVGSEEGDISTDVTEWDDEYVDIPM